MVLASKVWDESAIGNDDFSHTCTTGVSFPLHRVNELERAILSALEYQVKGTWEKLLVEANSPVPVDYWDSRHYVKESARTICFNFLEFPGC